MFEEVTVENYDEKRRALKDANSNLLGVIMREKELELNSYLSTLKSELRKSCGGKIPYDFPFLTDRRLRESELYGFCSRLPKGADLHVHDMALLPVNELIGLLKTRDEFYINTDRKSYDLIVVKSGESVPDGYICFSDAVDGGFYSEEELTENWTAVGARGKDVNIWDYFEGLFDKQACLSSNPSFADAYYHTAFRYYCKKNIQHVEVHIMLTDSIDESADYIRVMRQAYYDVKKEYPAFTVRVIGAGVKADNDRIELTKKCFLNSSYVNELVKDESDPENPADFVIGFDLVNEEDTSLPLSKFAPMLLMARRQFPQMKLYVHGGESIDAGNDNLIDAYLLGASRVGHGLNLYRFPDLHSRFVKSEICLEVCPISNQTLGYTKDMRNHPATEYLRTGMAIALCSDDPAYMENETLTDDFFAGIVAWDLGVAEIKQLGINSIMYSGLDEEHKFDALRSYSKAWTKFVDEILDGMKQHDKSIDI